MASSGVKCGVASPVLAAVLPNIPQACGVYLFKDSRGRVLYVGKAVNLRHRLASYGKTPEKQDAKTAGLLKRLAGVDFFLTDTEREALILERNLIKAHRPRFNVVLRDDKNYLCLRLDLKEKFPALRFVRRFSPDGAFYFGPYASAGLARETLRVMKQVFGLRTCKEKHLPCRSRPCLDYQVGRCLAPCAGLVSKERYDQAVKDAILFLKGRGKHLLKQLKEEMTQAAANLDFERAALLRDRQRAISRTLEGQVMARPHFKDQDVLGLAQEGGQALILVLLVRGGLVTGSQEYYFPEIPAGGDLLGEFVKQYYGEGRPLPDEILLPQDIPDRHVLAEVLQEQKGGLVRLLPVRSPSKTARGRLLGLAAENAWAALRRHRQVVSPKDSLQDLQERLHLPQEPWRLECLDISTLQGGQAVGALVAFTGGVPDKSGYRRFRIKEVAGQDDYAMLREVVRRHYGRGGQVLPDLLVVDGGRGQLRVVEQALQELGLGAVPVVALAKAGSGVGGPVRDRLFLPGRKNPKFLPASSPGWLLLLRLRDEAHRFALTYHRRRARKELLASGLSQVPGLGPVRRQRLLKHYGDLERLKEASLEELTALPGFNRQVAQNLWEWLNSSRA